jgi:segregation and condensation protein A
MPQTENQTFEIALPQFHGPFDLLLFFIQRDELDIYDIPITKITEDFLTYIHQMKQMNIELASEFILVAATLMKIKAQMLLPRKKLDDEGNEIDPREELVQKIIEYKQYKEFSEKLHEMELEQLHKMRRPSAKAEIEEIAKLYETDFEMEHITITKLMRVFQNLLEKKRAQEDTVHHQINKISYDIAIEKELILNKLGEKEKVDFERLFDDIENRLHAIYHFLAILELVQEEKIQLIIGEGINNFWISKRDL